MKIFIDANVLISAFATNGVSRALVHYLVTSHRIIVSDQILVKTRRVLIAKVYAQPEDVEVFLAALSRSWEIILPPFEVQFVVRDPNDVLILAAAIKSAATFLVTGDKDLLTVDVGNAIGILRPREMLALLTPEAFRQSNQ